MFSSFLPNNQFCSMSIKCQPNARPELGSGDTKTGQIPFLPWKSSHLCVSAWYLTDSTFLLILTSVDHLQLSEFSPINLSPLLPSLDLSLLCFIPIFSPKLSLQSQSDLCKGQFWLIPLLKKHFSWRLPTKKRGCAKTLPISPAPNPNKMKSQQ